MDLQKNIKKAIIAIWILFILCCIGFYIQDPARFTPKNIADTLSNYSGQLLLIYLIISVIRGFSLLPSTPFVIAGTFLFKEQPVLVFWISLLGITMSSTLIYYFSDFLGFSKYFEKKSPEKIEKIRSVLNHKYGFLFIIFWSFFPFVPTDLVSYIAGSMKMNFWRFIVPLFIGECILVGSIVWFGGALFH